MNEELVKALVEATDWYLSSMLYGPLREVMTARLFEELPERTGNLVLNPLGMRVHVDEFLADNVMVLCKGKDLVGMVRFEQGQVVFIRFKETPSSWGFQPTDEMRHKLAEQEAKFAMPIFAKTMQAQDRRVILEQAMQKGIHKVLRLGEDNAPGEAGPGEEEPK